MVLSISQIEAAHPGITPDGRTTTKNYKMSDALGLYLSVTPSGSKSWRMKYRFAGKEKLIVLGRYPEVSLNNAREKRDHLRALLNQGTDPGQQIQKERAAQRMAAACKSTTSRFSLDHYGAITFRLGNRKVILSPSETLELRTFLDATRAVIPKE